MNLASCILCFQVTVMVYILSRGTLLKTKQPLLILIIANAVNV